MLSRRDSELGKIHPCWGKNSKAPFTDHVYYEVNYFKAFPFSGNNELQHHKLSTLGRLPPFTSMMRSILCLKRLQQVIRIPQSTSGQQYILPAHRVFIAPSLADSLLIRYSQDFNTIHQIYVQSILISYKQLQVQDPTSHHTPSF